MLNYLKFPLISMKFRVNIETHKQRVLAYVLRGLRWCRHLG
jgi:hypothetical protein